MQVMPMTWTYVEEQLIGHRVPHTADGNVRVGIAYLRHLLRAFDDRKLAIAAYARQASTVVNGMAVDEAQWKRDIDAVIKHVSAPGKKTASK